MFASHLCSLACGDSFIKKKFAGVFPRDGLPAQKGRFRFYIVNLDAKHQPGSHWVAIVFKKDTALYFDSYGHAPMQEDIINFMNRNSQTIKYNSIRLQNFKTSTCGIFSLYFLYRLSRNLSINQLDMKNTIKNESFIKLFLKKKLTLAKCCHKVHFSKQTCRALINSRKAAGLF